MKYKVHNMSTSKKVFLSLSLMLFALAISIVTMFVSRRDTYALSSSDVYTLYDTDWNRDEYLNIVKKLGFTSGGNADENAMLNFKGSTYARILQSSGEWTVRIGGIDFTAVYLSNDMDGNVILTLWQAESQKLTKFNQSYSMANAINPRSNAYSTSFIRTAVLNNSGSYYLNYGDSRDDKDAALQQINYSQSSDHEYALFTTGAVSDFLVSPNKVNWQLNHINFGDEYVNELDDTTSGYASISANKYTDWGNDKIWLPSIDEIAYIWNPTNNQRRNAYDSWLRSANIPNESSNNYNTAYAYAYRLYAQGTPAQDYITSEYAVRPAFHLNLTNISKKVALTTGYENTDTPNAQFTALQNAWKTAIDNSGDTSYSRSEFRATDNTKVAEVYYDSSYASIVFKLFADWGAKLTTPDGVTHAYPVFGGEIETKLGAIYPSCSYYTNQGKGSTIVDGANRYYLGGALYIGPGVKVTIDLNGHDLNRNLYDPSVLTDVDTGAHNNRSDTFSYNGNNLYYGMVIYNVDGDLTIDDTNKYVQFEDVDANGVKNVGRITGGRRKTSQGNADGVTVADWESQGSGVQCYGSSNLKAKFLLKNGAICYCSAETRAGALKLRRTNASMEGGMMTHCSSTHMGGATYVHTSVFNLKSGFVCYNYAFALGGAIYLPDGGGSTIECYGINMNYNYCGGQGGAICASFGEVGTGTDGEGVPHRVIVHSGNFIGNHSVGSGGALYTKPGSMPATLTIYNGVFKDNVSDNSGGFMYVAYATLEGYQAQIKVHGGLIENNSAVHGGVFYIEEGKYMGDVTVTNGTFRNNHTTIGNGGAIYMKGGTFTMSGGTFDNNRAESGTGGALYMRGGTMNLNGGSFVNNVAEYYPGFYCGGSINISGDLVVKNNKTIYGRTNNIYLATEDSIVNVTGALTGDISVNKSIPASKNTVNIAKGSGYTMDTADLLAFHCDAGDDYLFSVNTSDNSIYMSLKPQHVHSYETYRQDPTCTHEGYEVNVCTGCQEIQRDANGKEIINFIAPTGHSYVCAGTLENGENCLVCSKCGDKLYFEHDHLSDVNFTGQKQERPITWRLYTYNSNGQKVYCDNINNDIQLEYINCTLVGSATARIKLDNITLEASGYYVIPYGSNAGKVTDIEWTSQSTLSGNFEKEMFRITKTNVYVEVTPPNEPKNGWFVGDASKLFGDVSVIASINGGANIVTDLGDLYWLQSDGTYSVDYPKLLPGENTYYWRWTPNTTYSGSIDSYSGSFDVSAREYELDSITASKNDNSAIFDNIGWEGVKENFTVSATYIVDDSGNIKTETIEDYKVWITDGKGNDYNVLVAGAYYFVFEYTYAGVTKTYTTTDTYNIEPQPMNHIKVSLVDSEQKIYDNLDNLEDLRSYLIVVGYTETEETAENQTVLDSYILECTNWNKGTNPISNTYTVTIKYGETSTSIGITVYPNSVSSLSVDWTQNKETNTMTDVSELNDYGTLIVTVNYADGSTKVVPMSKNNQAGYTLTGDLTETGTNKVTITYSEANKNGSVSSASAVINVETVEVSVTAINYEIKENKAIFKDDNYTIIKDKIRVYVTYPNGSSEETFLNGVNPTDRVYFAIDYTYYSSTSNIVIFAVNVYSYKSGNLLYVQEFQVTPSVAQVVSISVETIDAIPEEIPETISLEYFKNNYVIIKEIYNDNTNTIKKVYDPSDSSLDDTRSTVGSRITLSTPSGKLVIGNNTINVVYVDETGKTFTGSIDNIHVVALTLDHIEVTIAQDYLYTGTTDRLKDNLLFTSSNINTIKQYITVVGYRNDQSVYDVPITEYNITGSMTGSTNGTPNTFTIVVSALDSQGETKTCEANIYAMVDLVTLSYINAVFTQGDKEIYENTQVSDILSNIVVTANYNDGSFSTVYSGFTVSVTNDGVIGGFKVGGDNILTVTYSGKSVIANGEVNVIEKRFENIKIESRQYGAVLYPTSSYEDISKNILVTAYFSDGTSQLLSYGSDKDYDLVGSFEEDGVYVVYNGESTLIDVLTITPLSITSINSVDVTELNKIHFFSSYTIDMLKNYIVVSADYNNGQTRVLEDDEYNLTGNLVAGQANIITVTANGKTSMFTVNVVDNAVVGINSVVSNQNDATIYASTNLDALNNYIIVTALLLDGDTAVLDSSDFYITGTINDDGSYDLQVKLNGIDYSNSDNTPYSMKSTDASPIITLTPITPSQLIVTNNQNDTKLIFGVTLSDVSEYLQVKVVYNDTTEKVLEYGEYTLSGTLMAFDQDEECPVTASYTYNGVTKQSTTNVIITPVQNESIEAILNSNPIVYYSTIYDSDGQVKTTLNSVLRNLLEDYITVNYIKNNGDKQQTLDYKFTSCAVTEASSTPEDIKNNGGYVTITLKENVAGISEEALLSTTFQLYVTKIEPINISATQNNDIYSSYTSDEIKSSLTINEVYNDGSTKVIESGYNITTISGSVVLGGLVTLRITYFDEEAFKSVTGTIVIDVILVQPTSIDIKFEENYKIYSSTTESILRRDLIVTAHYNDNDKSKKVITDYTIEDYTLTPGDNELTLSYTLNGTTVTNTITIPVANNYVKDIRFELHKDGTETEKVIDGVTYKLDENSYITYDETNKKFIISGITIYNSQSINVLRNYITIDAIDNNNSNIGSVESYFLIMSGDSVWGAGSKTIQVNFSGSSDVTVASIYFDIEVVEYAIDDTTINAIFDNTKLSIYEDYQFENIIDNLKNNVLVTATWNDGYNHADEYKLNVIDVLPIEGVKDQFTIKYTYAKVGETNPQVYQNNASVNLVGLSISTIEIIMNDEYTIYNDLGDDGVISAIANSSRLYATFNSGNSQFIDWNNNNLSYNATNVGFEDVDETQYTKYQFVFTGDNLASNITSNVLVYVTPIARTSIEVSFTQYEGDEGILYTSATGEKILSTGQISMTAHWNYGRVEDVQVLASYLSFDFSQSDIVTVNFDGLSDTFTVTLTEVVLTGITASLNNESEKIYTSSSIATLAQYITVTAEYNDGSSRTLGYSTGTYRYTFAEGSSIQLDSPVTAYFDIQVEYVENYVRKTYILENIEVNPDELVENPTTHEYISAAYNQKTPLYQSGGIEKVTASPNTLVVNATYKFNGTRTLTSDQYQVVYMVGDQIQETLPASGNCNLTVLFEYNNETYSTTFEIKITAKAEIGIEVEYTANGNPIYTTTTLSELVKDTIVSGNTVEAKGNLEINLLYNDGDKVKLEDITYGTDYTLSGDLSTSNVVTVTYNGYSDTFEVTTLTPEIVQLTATWKDGFTLYVNSTRNEIRNNLIVKAIYNDDGHTQDLTLTIAQYSISYEMNYIGNVDFTISPVIAVSQLCGNIVISNTAKQKITSQTTVTLQYLNDDGEWVNVPASGLVERKATSLRLQFVSEDESRTVRYISLDTSVITLDSNNNWIIPTSVSDSYYIYNIPLVEVIDDTLDMFDIDSSFTTTQFRLVKRAQTGVDIIYTKFDNTVVYTTTTLKELYEDVVYSDHTVSAKGKLEIYRLFNDSTKELVSNPEFTLSGRLNAGSNNINITFEGKTYSFKVNAVEPKVIDINVQLSATEYTFGTFVQDFLNNLSIYAIFDDDNSQPQLLDINSSASITYYNDVEHTQVVDDPFGLLGTRYITIDITGIEGYENIEVKNLTFNVTTATLINNVDSNWNSSYEFTGSTPTFNNLSIIQNNRALVRDVDYTLSTTDNYFAGTGKTLTVTGIGNYTGSFDLSYSIICASNQSNYNFNLIELKMDNNTTYVYSGTAKLPVFTVTYDGVAIADTYSINTYYTSSELTEDSKVSSAINAGTYYFQITIGGTNIVDTYLYGNFEIQKADIEFSVIDFSSVYGETPNMADKFRLVSGENYNNEISPVVTTTATVTSPVGEYDASLNIDESYYNNYNITINNAKHNITKKDINVTITIPTQLANLGFTEGYVVKYKVTSSDFVKEDDDKTITVVNPTYTFVGIDTTYNSTTMPSNPGRYTVTMNSPVTAIADNYNVTITDFSSGTLRIEEPQLISVKEDSPYKFTKLVKNGLRYSYVTSTTHDNYDSNDLAVLLVTDQKMKIKSVLDCIGVTQDQLEVYNTKGVKVASSKYNSSLTLISTGYTIKFVKDGFVRDEIVVAIKGDYNGDGKVNATDVSNLKSVISEKKTSSLSKALTYAMDLNSDGKLNATDVSRLKAVAA